MADYDYIIVGGGSAGCALANRVSEDPAAHVLLLGSRPTRRFDVDRHPGGLHEPAQPPALHFGGLPPSRSRTCTVARPQSRAARPSADRARSTAWSMCGNPLDYETWVQFGNRGWSYEGVLPYSRNPSITSRAAMARRSGGGPLNVAALRERAELDDAFIDAAVAEGFPRNPDYNNGNQRGFG